jgi:diguanylate cyclase (GGDEF)-like protein
VPTFTDDQVKHIFEAVKWFESNFRSFFLRILSELIPHFQKTSELSEMSDHLDQLLKDFADPQTDRTVDLDGVALSCLKRALLDYRRSMAKQFEWYKSRTIHPEVIHTLEMHVSPLDELLEQDWIREARPAKRPRLTEYISVEQAERVRRQEKIISLHAVAQHLGRAFNQAAMANKLTAPTDNQYEPPEREYDEKFHILQAPGLFLKDLDDYRERCEMRGASIVIGYIDIDGFKSFNERYGETDVDRRVLPTFMAALEAHVFAHGFAYRFGGDEYILLLPNMSFEMARNFLDELRRDLAEVKYPGVSERTTVSIGFCYVDPDCSLTDCEAMERANDAKKFAKDHGRNCIATFRDDRFDKDSLYIVGRAQNLS